MQSGSHLSKTPRNATGSVVCCLNESTFQIVFGNWEHCVLWAQEKRTIQTIIDATFKSQHLWWYWVTLVPMAWVTYTSVKAILMLKGAYRFWRHICCHPINVFFMDVPAYFTKTISSHILHMLQQHGFVIKEYRY